VWGILGEWTIVLQATLKEYRKIIKETESFGFFYFIFTTNIYSDIIILRTHVWSDNMVNQSLKYSLTNHKIITIMYLKGFEITQRKIQVLKMDDETIKALDIDKGKFRTFKIENILSAIDTKLIDSSKATRGNFHAN